MNGADSSPGLQVIVVNYRTGQDLDRFIDSYRTHKGQTPTSLWVCDVAPIRGEEYEPNYPGFTMHFSENVGYAKAVNHAALFGSEEVVAIFNADVLLTEGALDRCYEALMAHDDWGVLGPLQTNGQGRITHAGIFGTNDAPKHSNWQKTVSDEDRCVREAVTVSGSAYFIKRSTWDELRCCPTYLNLYPEAEGAFLPTPFYYEETACSYHARSHGWNVMYYGLVEITHKWHESVRANNMESQAAQWMTESQKMFRQFCDHHSISHD